MATEVLPDERALRFGRRERALAAMQEHDLDALVLGRPANVRYVAGVPLLWNAGARPFGPGCVLLRSGEIYLLTTWDEGVPEEIPHDHLYGITWNPMNLVTVLQQIGAEYQPRRVGTDALSPLFAKLLPTAFANAEIVDGEPALRQARMVKTDDEVAAIRVAIDVAEAGLAVAVGALRPGASRRDLAGLFMEAIAALGVTTPATQNVVRMTSRRPGAGGDRIEAADLVTFDAGVVAGGYTGEVSRTYLAGDANGHAARVQNLYQRWDGLWARLLDACQPGASGAALLAAYEAAGEELPAEPVARGLGLGLDEPVVLRDLPATAAAQRLDPGTVLYLTGRVADPEVGEVIGSEAVLITPTGPEVLTSSPFWHL
ncbi:MAG TPA: M24 family metallopeptidase [Frankiaceae bacterium]|jgi:Xaa-Pro aminopeptidase|nr:M24 family metallopeptidase [Frankiaceae bacterium]